MCVCIYTNSTTSTWPWPCFGSAGCTWEGNPWCGRHSSVKIPISIFHLNFTWGMLRENSDRSAPPPHPPPPPKKKNCLFLKVLFKLCFFTARWGGEMKRIGRWNGGAQEGIWSKNDRRWFSFGQHKPSKQTTKTKCFKSVEEGIPSGTISIQ